MKFLSYLRGMSAAAALTAVATALVPTASSALDPTQVPVIGADTGRFNLPISCAISLGTLKLVTIGGTVDIQGVAPVQLGPGQVFYLSQGKGALTLPAWLATLGGLVTINSADAVVSSLIIGASNSTPSSVDLGKLYNLSVTNVPVTSGQPITVGLPLSGTFLVGPYVAPSSGQVEFSFQGATAAVTLKSSTGVKFNITAQCSATTGNASLLAVAVGSQVDASQPANFEGQPINFPPVVSGSLDGIVNAPYKCNIGTQQYDVGIAVGGIIPLSVKRTSNISFTQASGALTLPAATVNSLMDSGVTTLQGNVSQLNLLVTGGTPATSNVLPKGTAIPLTTLQRDTAVILSLPVSGTVTAGPYTPTATATSMIIGMGTAAGTLQFNGNGQNIDVTCAAPQPAALLVDAPVE